MENKKGCPVPCSSCPARVDGLSDRARKRLGASTNGALMYFGHKDLSLTWIANSLYETGLRREEMTDAETRERYPELTEAVGKCTGPYDVEIKAGRKILGLTVIGADTEAFCGAVQQEIGEIEANNVINYFTKREKA